MIFCIQLLYSASSIQFYTGFVYHEEAFINLYQSQMAPYFRIHYTEETAVRNWIIQQNFMMEFHIFPVYFKNYFVYYTDKTLNVTFPVDYRLLFISSAKKRVSFAGGAGLALGLAYDRYSFGTRYWFSQLKFEPLPYLTAGILLRFHRFKLMVHDSTGAFLSYFFQFNRDEYFYYNENIHIKNEFYAELSYRINRHIRLLALYNNQAHVYIDTAILSFGFFRFVNSFSFGAAYDF